MKITGKSNGVIQIAIATANVNANIILCFFTFIKNFSETTKLTLLNIPSELFAILNLRRYDKNVRMFNNNLDYIEDKHELVNRKFHVVK